MDTTSLWLHNKLGTANDSSWTSGSICSQLNKDVLKNIKECFPDLQTQVKLKLLLSFFHIPRRMVEEWKKELEEIIEVAGIDSELWVSMIAETMKTFPASGSLNTEISDYDETRPIFLDMVNDLRRLVNRHTDLSMLPLECQYLNKAAFISVVGQQPQSAKHFTLKRKPKSVQLRAELLQKSVDAQSTLKKASAPTIPLRSRGMPRKMTDTTPLKGIPSRMPTSGFRSPVTTGGAANRPNLSRTPAGRKEGGVKLIDFSEQPIGLASAKRRKKQEAEEAHKKAVAEAQEQAALAASNAVTSSSSTAQQANATSGGLQSGQVVVGEGEDVESNLPSAVVATNNNTSASSTTATPDYAAGLTASTIYTQPATPAPVAKVDNSINGQINSKSKPVPPLVPVGHDLSTEDIEMVDEEEEEDEEEDDGDRRSGSGPGRSHSQEEDVTAEVDTENEEEEMVEEDMEEDQEQQVVIAQQQQIQIQPQPNIILQPQQTIMTTNSMGTIKVQTAQGTTPSGLIIKSIDPSSQQQRLPFNQIYTQGQVQQQQQGQVLQSTSTIQMPPGITVVSTSGGQQQIQQMQGTPTKIVQIKTAPTTYMMQNSNNNQQSNAPPPLIATNQQGQQYVTLQQSPQQQQQQQKKTVLVTTQGGQQIQVQQSGSTGNMVFVSNNNANQQLQQGGQMQTAQIITNAAGQRFVMTPQKMNAAPTTINAIQSQQSQQIQGGTQSNKPIILSNQTISGGNKGGVIIRSIGPTGAAVYQQIPMSSVTRLQNLGGAGQTTFIQAKKPDVPALVPTSGAMTMMMQQQGTQQQQQQPTLITATRTPQQRAPGTTIIRPVLASNVQQIQGLQGYTIVQRGGQPTLIQAIPQQQQQQQQQQVQRIITQQQPTQIIQQQQTIKRQVVVQQPARKGLTLAPEHANKVTEMFRCANKVTRIDKALILSFIAGQTENPRPNAENVLNITLNQSKEKIRQDDNTEALMLVDTVIRLDYNTMEYKTFSRYHRLDQQVSAGGGDDTNNNSKVAIKLVAGQQLKRAAIDKSGL